MSSPFDKLQSIKKTHVHPNEYPRMDTSASIQQRQAQQKPINEQSIRRSYDPSRVPTGIRGFDQLIEGGFKLGSINLISGGTGTGKTIFAVEYLINGIYMFNESGIYVSFDESKQSVYNNMKTLGWDLEKLEKENKFVFVEYTPGQMMKILSEGGGLLDNLMSKTHAKRLVIDSISTFLLINSSEFGKRDQLINLFKLIGKWDVTAVLTNQYTPLSGHESKKESLSITFEADSITQLYFVHDDINSERRRLLEVYKMRGTNHVTKAVSFTIDERGIDIIPPMN